MILVDVGSDISCVISIHKYQGLIRLLESASELLILLLSDYNSSITSLGMVLKVSGMKQTIRMHSPDIIENTTITGKPFYRHTPTTFAVTVVISPPISEIKLIDITLACVGKASFENTQKTEYCLAMASWKRKSRTRMIMLTARLAQVSSVWSHRKMRATALTSVQPKQAKQRSFLLKRLMTNAAVKLASTCEEARANPLMQISKWKEPSMRDGAQNSKDMVHCSKMSTSVRYLVDLYLNISNTVTFFIATLLDPYKYCLFAFSISYTLRSAYTPFIRPMNSNLSRAFQGEFLRMRDMGVSTTSRHIPTISRTAGTRQQKRKMVNQSSKSQYQKILMTDPIPQNDWMKIVAFSLAVRSTVSTRNMKQMMQQFEIPRTATDSPPATTTHSRGKISTVPRPPIKHPKLMSMRVFFPASYPNSVSNRYPPAIPKNMMAMRLSSSSLAPGHRQSPSSFAKLLIVMCMAYSLRVQGSSLQTQSRQFNEGSMLGHQQGSWQNRKGTLKSSCPLKQMIKAQKMMVICWYRPKEPTLQTSQKNTWLAAFLSLVVWGSLSC